MSLGRRLVVIGLTGSGLLYVSSFRQGEPSAYRTRVFASSIIRVAFDGDFFNPDFTWALYRVYLCTVVERNLAEIIADLPASFAVLRGAHRKTQTLLSRGTTKASEVSGSSGVAENSYTRASKRPQFSNDESVYHEDEIPLKDSHVPAENRVIIRQTSIDIRAHTVNAREQEQRHQALVRPWDKTSTNV